MDVAPPVPGTAPGRETPAEARLEYHRLHRAGPRGAWRPLLGVLVVLVGAFLLAPLVWQLVFAVGFVALGEPLVDSLQELVDTRDPSPLTLAFLNVVLASAIGLVWAASRLLHRLPLRWVTSVGPRMRWRYFTACFGLSVLALVATLVVTALVPQDVAGAAVEANDFTSTTRDFLLVVLLLTPWQAAGEEYLFRGYLTQAIGGLVGGELLARVLAVVVPALLFGLAHGAQDLPVFFDRFAFGLVAGVLVVVTGGLEAAIAMHVLNNFLAFGLALAFADLGDALNPTGGSWWSLPGTLTQSLVYLGLAWWAARRMGLPRTVDRGVLAGPDRPVYRSGSAPQGA
ncbi:CPBP family intramembrane glutamic endopeptidase [Nocardioides solisilvae]|uniref:CPBP family intramembrane glutamic endopeptidase n=1 Tax=Nocardioides solisilvae TaxID=1542435 RepID=UPI000D746F0B|nr:CPBP family intramembrane glutamic endopeptidase [Nocardioides solisilvae]